MSASTPAIRASVSGIASRRSVCPVGAVSTTTSSRGAAVASRCSSMRPISSSTPGSEVLGIGVTRAVVEPRLDPDDPDLAGRRCRPSLALTDLTQAGEEVGLDGRELLLGDLAQLQLHLRGQQLLTQHAVVVELAVDGVDDLVEHEPDAADEERVDDDHDRPPPRPASDAIAAVRSSGATGLGTCI